MNLLSFFCCFSINSYTSRFVDISLIVLNAISLILSILALAIIKWKNVGTFSLIIMILIFLLIASLLTFSIIIHIFRKCGLIKTTTKEISRIISTFGFFLTIILFVFCFVGDITHLIDFTKTNHPCADVYINGVQVGRNLVDKNSIDCSNYYGEDSYVEIVTVGEYLISYFCFTYTEIAMIFAFFLWRSSKFRIINEIDGPIPDSQSFVMQQPVIGAQLPKSDEQIKPQYVSVKGNEQKPNMKEGGYNNIQNQQQGQNQHKKVKKIHQIKNNKFNVRTKPESNSNLIGNIQDSTNRKMK